MNFLNQYSDFKSLVSQELESFRQAGFEYVSKLGLPTRKDENWKYSSTKELGSLQFIPPVLVYAAPTHDLLAQVKKHVNPEFINLVFVDGTFSDILSSDLPAGLTMTAEASRSGEVEFKDSFDAMNAAYVNNIWHIECGKNISVDKPVNIVNFVSGQEEAGANGSKYLMVHPRFKVVVGAGSSLKMLVSSLGEGCYFSNSVASLEVRENAKLLYVNMQADSGRAYSIARTEAAVAAGAQLDSLSFACGGKWGRHTLQVKMLGEGGSATVNGLVIVKDDQHMDNNTSIEHHVGNCQTSQLYKGILDGQSRSVFNGRVFIAQDAQKANSEQLNNNLLLSSQAEADSKPMLEIYADDVKAAHGSTVGQLSKEELFYLQSRAIPKDKAIGMLSYGFVAEVLLKVENEAIQHWLKTYLDKAFAGLRAEA